MPNSNHNNGSRVAIATGLFVVGTLTCILAFATPIDREIALRTLCLGLAASAIAVPIGALAAWVCLGSGFMARVMLIAIGALLLVPIFIQVSAWDAAFGKLGWLTTTQGQVLVPLVSGWTAAIWIHAMAGVPQVALILLIGHRTGNRIFEEQALLESSPMSVFWNVTLKRLWPLVILSVIWITISCAREIAVTDLYQIGTLAEQIYLGYSLGLNSVGGTWTPEQFLAASAVGPGFTMMLIATMAGLAFYLFMRLTDLEYESDSLRPRPSTSAHLPRNIVGILLMVLMLAIPIGNTVLRACFFVRPVDGIPTQGYSLSQLFRVLRRSFFDYRDEFVWSFLIAFVSSTIIIILATTGASAARRSRPLQLIFVLTMAVCCALPGPFIGTTLSGLFSATQNDAMAWLYNYTIFAPVLANLIYCWPIGALLVWFIFRKIPQDALDSSSIEGAGGGSRFFQFGLRLNSLALVGCWLLSFAICFGELSASQIVRPAGIDTVPRKMLGDLHAGVDELTAGITIITASLVMLISLAGWSFIRLYPTQIGRK